MGNVVNKLERNHWNAQSKKKSVEKFKEKIILSRHSVFEPHEEFMRQLFLNL